MVPGTWLLDWLKRRKAARSSDTGIEARHQG
jgi:hypothetical protein